MELSKEKSIIFLVDELDRCLPSYAIKVLERLHHLFDGIENIIVIISIDKKQLEHSIQQIYGNDVNVDKYLKKFINFSVTLDNGTLNTSFQNKYSAYFSQFSPISEQDQEFFEQLFLMSFDKIDIRTQEKLIYRAKLIHETICNENCNPALLCFEIMYVAFSYKSANSNLYWIPKINKATYSGLKEKIGSRSEEFLQKSEKLVGTVASPSSSKMFLGKSYREIKDKLLDNTFWIFATLFDPITANNFCFDYFCQLPNSLNKEVELAKEFDRLAKILK